MSDRTPQEREAARLERERRRAEREGRTPPPPPQPPPAAERPQPAPQRPRPAAERPQSEPQAPAPAPAPREPDPVEPKPVPQPARAEPVAADLAATSPHGRGGYGAAGDASEEHANETGRDADYDFDTGEHEFEAPAGTRRVSLADSGRGRHTPRLRRGRGTARGAGGRRGGRRVLRPASERPRRRWRGRVGAAIALVVAAALIWFLVALFQPLHGSGTGRVTVVIPARSTSSQVGDLLARDGVIDSSFFFQLRATLAGERSDLRSGTYVLRKGMTYGDVLARLTQAPPAAKVSTLTITEGRTRQYIDSRLRAEHLATGYLAATRRSPLIDWSAYGLHHTPPSLEGFLFPDTYQLVDPVKVTSLVHDQVAAFKSNFARVDLSYAKRKRLTAYDVVTIASMIEAEANSAHDRPLIASVIYNRLAAGMMLQFDSTTRYATGNYAGPLTVSQLKSRSPWNTHTHLGLPPTPIDSPGLAALQAAAHPAQTNYLFFFARRCGRGTDFAATYSRFLADAAQDAHHKC